MFVLLPRLVSCWFLSQYLSFALYLVAIVIVVVIVSVFLYSDSYLFVLPRCVVHLTTLAHFEMSGVLMLFQGPAGDSEGKKQQQLEVSREVRAP